ncbi:GntR family transcriptional regulator [Blautia sp. AF19-1]|nr:GntR family transcriptional regulator [Agathobacter sp.]MBS5498011.1 GntR family transcriptional regulator [Blautia sp.]NSD90219.1 GntR family transcriptional regulator [Fusicatenibacter saccharivorans]RHR39216.1 GntR family transcriptional regulator [Blautia sp. AF19-1]RHV94137.1 GntR family transcriptional regulator [Blautia sp. OF09-25XD]HCO40485.1 hypothetical protein [Lachnospiraceae bacterium]
MLRDDILTQKIKCGEKLKAEVTSIFAKGREAAKCGDIKTWNDCSDDFHLVFYRYCNNSRLTESAKRLKSGISIFSNQYSQETAIQTSIDAEHEAIFAAYQNGETEKAVQMMKTHLNDSHALLLKYSGPAAAYCASSGTHFIFFISPSKSIRIRSQTFATSARSWEIKSMAICSSC